MDRTSRKGYLPDLICTLAFMNIIHEQTGCSITWKLGNGYGYVRKNIKTNQWQYTTGDEWYVITEQEAHCLLNDTFPNQAA